MAPFRFAFHVFLSAFGFACPPTLCAIAFEEPSTQESKSALGKLESVEFVSPSGLQDSGVPRPNDPKLARYGIVYSLPDVHIGARGEKMVRDLTLSFDLPVGTLASSQTEIRVHCWFPEIRVGQTFPTLGATYKVAAISNDRQNTLKLQRISDASLLKELGVDPLSATAILGSSCTFSFHSAPGSRESIVKTKNLAPSATNHRLEATISVLNIVPGPAGRALTKQLEVTVAVGDVIPLLDGYLLKVKAIVAPDATRGIVGWVEFTTQRVAEEK